MKNKRNLQTKEERGGLFLNLHGSLAGKKSPVLCISYVSILKWNFNWIHMSNAGKPKLFDNEVK